MGAFSLPATGAGANLAPVSITVQANGPGARINPAMWGIFFEDINFGADGGLYAELVKNRGFEFPDPLMGWINISPSLARGELSVRDDNPFDPANPHYVRLESQGTAPYGLANTGFRGMGVRRGETYDFSARFRKVSGAPVIRLQLYGGDGTLLDTTELSGFTSDWKKYTATLHPNATDPKAKLYVLLANRGAVDVDFVSLFPQHTWKDRPGGLRADLVHLLADLKPGFLRFPGGCIVEGSVLHRRYQWKNTIGPIEDRKLLINRWNYEFLHRPTPDYFQSFGLGFYEYFQLCEDIGAEPLPILNCGMACQFNSGELCPMDQLDPFIQDALDLIEFANGPVTSTWGAKRAALGHPAPFHLKMLGVGNEQWGPQYLERYARFAKVLKAKHPEIMLVADSGPSPADDRFNYLWPKLCELKADIVDQHCYANPLWFLANTHRYDNYDRNGPKVFMGEYAAQSVAIVSTKNRNNLDCALAEAAYMTGLERNADVVRMASYAPLFANADAWQWTPDLIWVNSLHAYATPNYYVQKLFMHNRGDEVLPTELEGAALPAVAAGRIGVGTLRSTAEFKDVRVTRGGQTLLASDFAGGARGWSLGASQWQTQNGVLQQTEPFATSWSLAGDPSWNDYTVSLKARKTSGAGGFQIVVRYHGPEDYVAWNLGGSDNTTLSLAGRLAQQDEEFSKTAASIETGKWYDLKIRLTDDKVDCFLDGKLAQSAEIPPVQIQRLYASAVQDGESGDVIVKVVNPGAAAEADVNLAGLAHVAPRAQATVLTSANLADENSFAEPEKVAPVVSDFDVPGPRFTYDFPQFSMTVLRLKTK